MHSQAYTIIMEHRVGLLQRGYQNVNGRVVGPGSSPDAAMECIHLPIYWHESDCSSCNSEHLDQVILFGLGIICELRGLNDFGERL